MNKVYDRINWENTPSIATPINESNLNKMDYAIDEIDKRVVELASKDSTINEAIEKANESIEKLNNDSADFKAFNERQDNPHNVTKEQVGLDKVDNTADKDKYVYHSTFADRANGDRNGKVIDLVYETIENVDSKDAETLKTAKEYADSVGQSTILTKTAKGTNIHLTDSLEGKCKVSGLVHNLFDKSIAKENKAINDETGEEFTTNNSYASDYINVSGIKTIYIPPMESRNYYAFYDSEKKFISGKSGSSNFGAINIPDGVFYIRTTVLSSQVDTYMINEGTTAHPYVPYDGYEVRSCGKNLFDKSKVTKNKAIDDQNGNEWDNSRNASDYISVTPNKSIFVTKMNGGEWGAFYDKNKQYISGVTAYESILIPSNAKYFRCTVGNDILDDFQIEYGTTATDYVPYQSDSVTITHDTDVAYISTFDGETNVFTDYDVDLNVTYANTDVGNHVLKNSASIEVADVDVEFDQSSETPCKMHIKTLKDEDLYIDVGSTGKISSIGYKGRGISFS